MTAAGGRYIRYDEKQDQPAITWALIRRVADYGRPYLGRIVGMLALIFAISLLSLVPPLLIRDLIDHALPNRDCGPAEPAGAGHDRHPADQRPAGRGRSAT